MRPNPQFPEDLITFTEEILNRKVHFPCCGVCKKTAIPKLSRVCSKAAVERCL